MKNLILNLTLIFLLSCISCTPEKDALIADFDLLHQEIKDGNLTEWHNYMDAASQEYIEQMSNVEYLTPNNLKAIGKKHGLSYFNALYYSENMDKIKKGFEDPFFKHLNQSKTPLFSQHEFIQITDKSRVGKENYICIGRINHADQRVISWLPYTKEGDSYKLNLIDLLRHHESIAQKQVRKLTAVRGDQSKSAKVVMNNAIDNLYDHPLVWSEGQ